MGLSFRAMDTAARSDRLTLTELFRAQPVEIGGRRIGKQFGEGQEYVVAFENGVPVGYIEFVIQTMKKRKVIYTRNTFTLFNRRKWKVATKLFYFLEGVARKRGIFVIVRANQSQPMIKLSQRMRDTPRKVVGKKNPPEKVVVLMDRLEKIPRTVVFLRKRRRARRSPSQT